MPEEPSSSDAYRESTPLRSRGYSWLYVIVLVSMSTRLVHLSHKDVLWAVPLLVVLWTLAINSLVGKQEVLVTPEHLQVHRSPWWTKRWPLGQVQRLERRDSPPGSWRDRWPFGQWRVYAHDSGPGVALHLADGGALYLRSSDPDRLAAAITGKVPQVDVGETNAGSGTASGCG
jgi:hypothetical protein